MADKLTAICAQKADFLIGTRSDMREQHEERASNLCSGRSARPTAQDADGTEDVC